jgi:hypothetical protein
MSPPTWLQKKVSRHRKETTAIRIIKDYDGNLLQFTLFLWGLRGVKGKKRGLTALTAHIFVA